MRSRTENDSSIGSRLVYTTAKLAGMTVSQSADIIANLAEVAVIGPARSVGSLLTSTRIPFRKKRQVQERMTQLGIEMAKLERRMGAKMAANAAAGMADPADDEEIRSWMKEITARKEEMSNLAGLAEKEASSIPVKAELAEEREKGSLPEKEKPEMAEQGVESESPKPIREEKTKKAQQVIYALQALRLEKDKQIARLEREKEDLKARLDRLEAEKSDLSRRLQSLEQESDLQRRKNQPESDVVEMKSPPGQHVSPGISTEEEVGHTVAQPASALAPATIEPQTAFEKPAEPVEEKPGPAQFLAPAVAVEAEREQPTLDEVLLEESVSLQEAAEQAQFESSYQNLVFQQAVQKALSDKPDLRETAIREMKTIKNPAVTRVLIRLAEDSEPTVRLHALEALQQQSEGSAFPLFVKALDDESMRVRLAAVRGMYQLDPSKAIPYLIQALGDEDAAVRRRAVTCLHWTGANDVVPNLIQRLADPDQSVRKAVVHALQDLRSKLAISRLIKTLNDDSTEIRKCAHRALERLTRREFDFDPSSSAAERAKAIAVIESWWKANRKNFEVG